MAAFPTKVRSRKTLVTMKRAFLPGLKSKILLSDWPREAGEVRLERGLPPLLDFAFLDFVLTSRDCLAINMERPTKTARKTTRRRSGER